MFETSHLHESRSFNPFRPPEVRQWNAVSLDLDLAWFVLTTYVQAEGMDIGCDQTTLIADEESLLQWLKDTPSAALVALHCVRPGTVQEERGLWRMVRVHEVWLLAEAEQRQGRLLVCKGEAGWFEPNRPAGVEPVAQGQRLLAQFTPR